MIHHATRLNLHAEHDKVTEILGLCRKTILVNSQLTTYIVNIAIVYQLHLQHHVHEKLTLGLLHYLVRADQRAVQLLLRVFLTFAERCRLTWEFQSFVQVRQIVLEAKDDI